MSLRKKIVLLIVPIIVTPMIISGWLSFNQLKTTTIEKSHEQMETLLEQFALYSETLIRDSHSNVRLFANNKMLRRYMVTPSEEERYDILQPLLLKQFQNYQKAYPHYFEFRLIFPNGEEDLRLVNKPIDNLTNNEVNTPFIKEILHKKEGSYNRIMRNPDDDNLALYIATALNLKDLSIESNSSKPKFRGYLVLTIDIAELLQQMEISKLGADGLIFIMNNTGKPQIFPNKFKLQIGNNHVSQNQIYQLGAEKIKTDVIGSGFDLSQTPTIETEFLNSHGFMKAIKLHDNFTLVTWLPSTGIIKKSHELATIFIIMTILAIVVTVLLLFTSLNYFVLKPLGELRSAANEIGKGVLNKAISIKSNNDEIGEVAYTFDEMRKNTLRSHEYLEYLVDERTKDVRHALAEAEKSSTAKSKFLSRMSHELRTPLNAILGFSQLFSYDRNLNELQVKNVKEINDSGKHLLALIDEVLDLSKIEAGTFELSIEPVSIIKVIKNCLVMIETLAKAYEVKVIFDLEPCDNHYVLADYTRVKQVILNLLSNAIKYNKKGGTVEIYCSFVTDGAVRINVKDTGHGILEENITHLFEPFNRMEAEHTKIEGTGIGLVITQQLVDLMGGELGVKSTFDLGSIFWFDLKECEPNIELNDDGNVEDITEELFLNTNDDIRILVAEDNPTNQAVLEQQLNILGYEADFANDGVEAFNLLKNENYHILLTDIHMPKMNGYELVKKIHDANKSSDMVIIAVSADAMDGQLEKCIKAGMDDYIGKPVHIEELSQKLSTWLNKKSFLRPVEKNPFSSDIDSLSSVKNINYNIDILIAEDEPINQELLQLQLNSIGFKNIDFASDGEKALECLKLKQYQLLLTDINMSKMGGFELVSNIRKSNKYPSLKIIAITGDLSSGEEKKYIEAGMDIAMAKPVSIVLLKNNIESLLPFNEIIETDNFSVEKDKLGSSTDTEKDDPPIIISELIEMIGNDEKIIKTLLNKFVTTSADNVNAIKDAYSKQDLEDLYEQSHKLKGGALSMGAIQLGNACKELQFASESKEWDKIEVLVPKINELHHSVSTFVSSNY